MKFVSFTFISVLVSFEVTDASNTDYLQEYMQTNLPPNQAHNPKGHDLTLACPEEVKIAWQVRPPFTVEKNASEDQSIQGIFHRALNFALKECCVFYDGTRPIMRYLAVSDNASVLHGNIFSGDATLVFPIQDDLFIDKSRWHYINILNSPGAVLVRREAAYSINNGGELFKAILGTWPIVVLSFLMSALAGICIWILDTRTNPTEFSRPFYLGVIDGFWWAVVTMSTVGYGDKTPKSISGRLFSVVWIITGITVCSILTATLSSALTNVTVSVERYDVTTGKTIGVPRESVAFKRAVNLGINITDFQSLHEAYSSLENGKVDGIMEEMFTAVEFIKRKSNSELSIAHYFEDKHGFGAAIKEVGFSYDVLQCLSNVTEFVSDDIYSNVSAYLKSRTNQDLTPPMENLEQNDPSKNDYSIFDRESSSFQGMILGMSVALFMFIACSTGFAGVRYLRQRRRPKKKVVELEEVEKGL